MVGGWLADLCFDVGFYDIRGFDNNRFRLRRYAEKRYGLLDSINEINALALPGFKDLHRYAIACLQLKQN